MIFAVARVMALQTLRDRGTFVLAFVLPPLMFAIFATIFSGAGKSSPDLTVAVVDLVGSEPSARFVAALAEIPSIDILTPGPEDAEAAGALVLRGDIDNAVIVTQPLTGAWQAPPVTIVSNAGAPMTGAMLGGQIERLLARQFPNLALRRMSPVIENIVGGLTPAQSQRLETGIAMLERGSGPAPDPEDESGMIAHETVGGGGRNPIVSYYAGAVAFMFLLFSSMQAAITLIEERNSGIMDRISTGRAGTDVLIAGKFLFLAVRGMLQVGLIFVFAWLAYGVDLWLRFGEWAMVTVISACVAASLALLTASACTTKQQANAISSFLVLIVSAIGGSMVPRFMMPQWLQDIGWLTPNAWVIEAYQAVVFRGEGLASLMPVLWPLAVVSVLALSLALVLARRQLRLA